MRDDMRGYDVGDHLRDRYARTRQVEIVTTKRFVVEHGGRPVYATDDPVKAEGVAEYLRSYYMT